MNRISNKITLPNEITCNINELVDYIVISYLTVHHQLYKNNISLYDMHFGNIFIHWLNKNSYMGDKYIGDIEEIIYTVNKKNYKIKTFGFVIKIGDVGLSTLKINPTTILFGHVYDVRRNIDLIKILTKENYPYTLKFLMSFKSLLPYSIYKETILYNILSNYPYSELTEAFNIEPTNIINDYLTPLQLLEKYDKYTIKNKEKINKNTLIIKV